MTKKIMSIKYKFSLFLICILFIFSLSVIVFVLDAIDKSQIKDMEDSFTRQLYIAEKYINQMYMTTDMISPESTFIKTRGKNISLEISSLSGMEVFLYDTNGEFLASSNKDVEIKQLDKLLTYGKAKKEVYIQYAGQACFVSQIKDVNNSESCIVIFVKSTGKEIELFNNIRNSMVSICLFIFAITLSLSIWYFNRFANKILRLNKYTNMIVNGSYEIETFKSNDELGELSKEIKTMAIEIKNNIDKVNNEKNNLKITNAKLKELESKQKQFFSNVTHEFKTPLTGIKAYSDLLEMYNDDPEFQRNAIQSIKKEASRLQVMIEKVLKLQSIERYDFEISNDILDLKTLIEDVVLVMRGKSEKNGIDIICNIDHCTIYGDKEVMTQVFMNLIDNAIKYNKKDGKIYISTEINSNASVIIKDTGIGIPEEDRFKIFEPFYTAAKDRSRETGGNGLGLSIVKQLLVKQKGMINLVESSSEGSTFIITLPLYNYL